MRKDHSCWFCGAPAEQDGSIYHEFECDGLKDASLIKLQHRTLTDEIERLQRLVAEATRLLSAARPNERYMPPDSDGWHEWKNRQARYLVECSAAEPAAPQSDADYRAQRHQAIAGRKQNLLGDALDPEDVKES